MYLPLIRLLMKVLVKSVIFLKKNWKWLLTTLVGLFLLLRPVTRRAEFSAIVPQASPTQVWDFMADFTNYKILNNKVLDFEVVDDTSIGHQLGSSWHYSVRYTELFENIPVGTNTALGQYHVYQDHQQKDLVIASTHRTCILPFSTWCLTTEAEDRFRSESTGTFVVEVIDYQCPWILQGVCKAEVNSQRSKVLNNLSGTKF